MKELQSGKKLVHLIENETLKEETLPNHGLTFSEGYDELYLYKFKKYLGSVSRAILKSKYC